MLEREKLHEVVIAEKHIFIYFNEVNALIIPEDKVEGQPFEQVAAALQDHIARKGTDQPPIRSE